MENKSEQPIKGNMQIGVSQFSGPLPPPILLKQYDEVLNGAAERIVAMAEREQRHRQEIEKHNAKNAAVIAKRGQMSGCFIIVLLIVSALACLFLSYPYIAAGIFSVTILGIGKIFVFSKK